jgi:hypothetical protein
VREAISIISLVLLGLSAVEAAPEPSNKPIHKDGMACRTDAQDEALKQWIIGIQNEADTALTEVKSAQAYAADVTGLLGVTVPNDISAVEQAVAQLRADRDKAEAHDKATTARLIRLRMIVAIALTALICMVLSRFLKYLTLAGPWMWAVYLGSPVVVFAMVYGLLCLI